ncbi:MAG TPA: Kdo hydroxylase family protein [Thermoanaerobaculia bacterium]|nr:Kdo hydroxylase family protein [Thermoanaerobaculia bacterium]
MNPRRSEASGATSIVELPISRWNEAAPAAMRDDAVRALEDGSVLLFRDLAFGLDASEAPFLSSAILASGKNVSYDASTGSLSPTRLDRAAAERLKALMRRFVDGTGALLAGVLPAYESALVVGRTSLRPVEVEGRSTSWRKDDTRLHVDAFPSSPVRDRRILRVFSNVNPEGRPRTWRLGEPFESVARRFLPTLSTRLWGRGWLYRALHVTKSFRSAYDHCMLQIHDRMKADREYQASAAQRMFEFPAGCTWIMFSDQVSHAVLAGQHALEQTYYLPVGAMVDPSKSPQRILERLTGRALA